MATIDIRSPRCPICLSKDGIEIEKDPEGGYIVWCQLCWLDGVSYTAYGRTEDEALDRLVECAEIE